MFSSSLVLGECDVNESHDDVRTSLRSIGSVPASSVGEAELPESTLRIVVRASSGALSLLRDSIEHGQDGSRYGFIARFVGMVIGGLRKWPDAAFETVDHFVDRIDDPDVVLSEKPKEFSRHATFHLDETAETGRQFRCDFWQRQRIDVRLIVQ